MLNQDNSSDKQVPDEQDDESQELARLDEILSTARSVRRKLDFERPIPVEVIYDCINVAVQAPTGMGGENWRFVVVDDPVPKGQIAELYRSVLLSLLAEREMPLKPTHKALIDRLHEIPAMIFVCVDGHPPDVGTLSGVSGQIAYYGSILPAAWSLMLALRARDIGTTWTSLLSSRQAEVAEILNLPDGVLHTIMLPIGYTQGAVMRRAQRIDASEVTFWNEWEMRRGD